MTREEAIAADKQGVKMWHPEHKGAGHVNPNTAPWGKGYEIYVAPGSPLEDLKILNNPSRFTPLQVNHDKDHYFVVDIKGQSSTTNPKPIKPFAMTIVLSTETINNTTDEAFGREMKRVLTIMQDQIKTYESLK